MTADATSTAARTGESAAPDKRRVGLCLSGGGYRAMLFHLGTLWRLNDAGMLTELDIVSSVSGGSITNGVLAVAWEGLAFDSSGVGTAFQEKVVKPVMHFARQRVDVLALLRGLFGPGTVNGKVAESYRQHFFGHRMLADLPPQPIFVFTASNLQTGALFRFYRAYAGDYRVGRFDSSAIDLAQAVAASSAFPPVLSPAIFNFQEGQCTVWKETDPDHPWRPSGDLHFPPYTTRVVLSDGGVYDNLGLEPLKDCSTVLVSDAGAAFSASPRPKALWVFQVLRVRDLQEHQTRALRKRHLIQQYKLPRANSMHLDGAYWGIGTDIAGYRLSDTLPCPYDKTQALAGVPTRLWPSRRRQQKQLVNWGYAVCDAALRAYVKPSLAAPRAFPFPKVGVG
jgi:NTE family protein